MDLWYFGHYPSFNGFKSIVWSRGTFPINDL